MERPYVLETPILIGGKINKTSPSKNHDKYLTPRTSILSKSIVVRLDLNLLLDFVNFHASTISKHEVDKEVDVETEIHGEPISCIIDSEGFYQYPQRPKLDWKS